MKFKTKILRDCLLPAGDLIFGQRMIRRLKSLEQAQYWSTARIVSEQNLELTRLIHVAYNEVPFYRNLMDDLKITPEDIRKISDLSKLPVTTKEILRQNYPRLTVRPTGQKIYEASTSGSTGKNFVVAEDSYTAGWYRASFMLSLEWAGWNIGEPHLQTGMTINRSPDKLLKDKLLGCHYFSAYNLDDTHLDTILDAMEHYKLQFLWGYPGSLYYIARRAIEKGWNRPLRSAVSWGDTLLPQYRKTIEQAFQTQVFDTYGCAEGIQVAAQCEYGNYHLHSLDAIVEFLDDSGEPVQPGSPGRIILTRLHPGPMPLIRYDVGDIGVPSPPTSCPCGRGFPLMQTIEGRNTDVVVTPSGNRLIVHFFTGVLEHFPQIDSFQVIQTEPNRLVLFMVPKTAVDQTVTASIIARLKEKGASDMDIAVQLVDDIPMTAGGKRRFIINRISAEKS